MINFFKSILNFTKNLIILALLLGLIIFMVDNRDIVVIRTNPLPFEIETRVFVVMIFFFLLGTFFGFLAFSKTMLNKSFTNFKDKIKIKKLQKQAAKLDPK
ncbi:MAG: hypothetical protein SFV53_05920 [Rickettsiales bacterium]|nr:hypothetical protein [Rickettsiales bacterium]